MVIANLPVTREGLIMRHEVSALAVFMLLLGACSETPDTQEAATPPTTPNAEGQFPANNSVDDRVEYYVTRLEPQLPMRISDQSVMDGVQRHGLEIELHYTILDSTITSQQVEDYARQSAPSQTCDNAMTAGMVRDGAAFRYTYSGAGLQRPVSVLVDQCN